MPVNIEFKARLHDLDRQEQAILELTQSQPEMLFQRDTFFQCSRGRLKLREISGEQPHLIQYFRTDEAEPRRCDYLIAPITDPTMLTEALERAHGIRGIVRKLRKLWIVDQTRIHLDHVDGLGDFIELEVVLTDEQDDDDGYCIAAQFRERLLIRDEDIIDFAYIDMLEKSTDRDVPQSECV